MDIVQRLREAANGTPAEIKWPHRILHDAADEIERLRKGRALPTHCMVEVISGPEGSCLAVNNHRVVGPKPWGGGHVAHAWDVAMTELRRAIPEIGQ